MKKVRLLLLLVVLSMVPAACTSPLALDDCDGVTCHDPEGGNHDPEGGNHDPEGGN